MPVRRRPLALAAAALVAALVPAGPRAAATAPGHAFLQERGGTPARWDPCAPVPWTLNPWQAPPGGQEAVVRAAEEVRRLSGVDLRFVGPTGTTPTGAVVADGAPRRLLVGWTTPERSDLLAGRGPTTVGVTRVRWRAAGAAGPVEIDGAVVALNADASAPARGPGSWYAYALHELGHAVGLGHVADGTPESLMTPVLDRRLGGFGAGDRAGLRQLGGCPDARQGGPGVRG